MTVGGNSGGESQGRNSGDEGVLRQRGIVHSVGGSSSAMGRCSAPKSILSESGRIEDPADDCCDGKEKCSLKQNSIMYYIHLIVAVEVCVP